MNETEKNLTADNIVAEKPDYEQEITAIIRGNDSPKKMLGKLFDYHENDIAQVIPALTVSERKKFYRICNVEMLSEIFEYFDEDDAGIYLDEMDVRKAADVISELETDTAAKVLHALPKDKRELIMDAIDPEIRKQIRLIASFDEDEIGSRMTTNYIVIRENLTVKQAMSELVRQAEENDNITTIFVVDENGEFYGAIDLKELITARSTTPLESLIATSFPYVYANELIDDCIEKLKDYSESIIPVLDNSNRILGVITSQSIIEVVDDEMGEDYARLAGLTAEEDLNEPLVESMKKRLPWLLILLCLGMLVSTVVGAFEKVIAQLTLIMAFQSLILDMAGNVGTQSLAVTIRVLMDENLTFKQKGHLVAKEMRVGLSNGLLLGIISFIFVGIYIHLVKHKAISFAFAVSGCIGTSLLLAMLISSAVGTLVPLFFKKIKVDPAVASGPLITTVNDLVAVVTYYGMSWVLLINVMHLA
ncbi:MAG: magnesium transporter [Lachnospiraceae bacterium]|nr:magnesium transporter [Lachnospiraceae bacterium]